jgi:hypothetical protein
MPIAAHCFRGHRPSSVSPSQPQRNQQSYYERRRPGQKISAWMDPPEPKKRTLCRVCGCPLNASTSKAVEVCGHCQFILRRRAMRAGG